ncbi:hypothetical protein ACUN9Y_13310 [Halomonas sp. V046]|uniref:hypothetical protein n=1 Tax=Halomonas sp. V046 TaxID=3459611 RepID=UPI004044D574
MSWFDGISSAVSAGFKTASKYATPAFDWLGDNPEAANLIGGIATGVGQAYLAGEQADRERERQRDEWAFKQEMYNREREDRFARPGEVTGYDTHVNSLTDGLITRGQVSGGLRNGMG